MTTNKRILIYLDDDENHFHELIPPANFELDTSKIPDGDHTLKIVSISSEGKRGIKKIDFVVRNGPEIQLIGMSNGNIVSDKVSLSVNAYGSESKEHFIVSGSKTPNAVPAWLWVIIISFFSWGVFYLISNWK